MKRNNEGAMMGQEEEDMEEALVGEFVARARPRSMRREIVSVVVWGFVLAGCVIAIALFTSHVLGWGR